MRRVSLFLLASALGCAPTPEAPTELSELTRYLVREWDHEDPAFVAEGLANVDGFLQGVDLEVTAAERAWIPGFLTADDLQGLTWPTERNLEDCIPISVAGASAWPVQDHARLQTEPDQTPAEPTAPTYTRTVTPADPTCFWDGSCAVIETRNEVRRDNLLMSVDFVMFKDFRWAQVGESDRRAVVSRSWFEESFDGDEGNTHLWLSFALDLWIEQPDGTTERLQALWSESDVGDFEDETVRNVLRASIDDIFDAGDDAIEELYHPAE